MNTNANNEMTERQAETQMNHGNKPETGSGQSWIYSSLIQTARPIASLAAKLGILPHLYNIYDRDFLNPQYNDQENNKLRDTLKKAETASVGFISLHVITQSDDETRIGQIGMSRWRSDGWTQMISVHCQIDQGIATSESPYPRLIASDFKFGDTEVIAESDIGPWLDASFRSFQRHQDIICLVGHDIHRVLHLVQPYWRVPSGVVILDMRAIWESQNQLTSHPLLKEILGGVIGYSGGDSLLDNAGNTTQFILELIQSQVGEPKEKENKNGPRYMNMGMNMWRSPSW